MASLQEIHASIEARLEELRGEIAALSSARDALLGGAASAPAGGSKTGIEPGDRRHRASSADRKSPGTEPAQGTGAAAVAAGAGGPHRSRPARRPKPSAPAARVLLAGQLEAMLAQAEDGLSAITVAKRSGAAQRQVLELLGDLEAAGKVRRTGTGRTSLWRLATDEEWVAHRAAQIERQSAAGADTGRETRTAEAESPHRDFTET